MTDPDPAPPPPAGRPTPQFFISDLCELLEAYMSPEHIREVYRAYLLGAEAHEGQHRQSGEPYIYHPIEVARILAELTMDAPTIIAALLHDVIEDTTIPKQTIMEQFGEQVAELVDGVSKLTQFDADSSQADIQAANFRKMLMAMTRDIRVILIKLADRLHNMRTLGAKKPASKRRIARETLEIYAPIAARLGMSYISLELEELGFQALYPYRCKVINHYIKKHRGGELMFKMSGAIQRRMREEGIKAQVIGREKRSYSIYKKMQAKRNEPGPGRFSKIKDLYAFRVIVDSVDSCYRALGVIHGMYKPRPYGFKDYIAIPKGNGYQSLHTVLTDFLGQPFEVQIRTHDMHAYAEFGIATHGLYKAGEDKAGARRRAGDWLRRLLEFQQNAGSPREFLETVKIDLFPDEIYVFTPKGKIIELPRGSTAVDFAYAVHSDLGDKIIAAKVDDELLPSLDMPLETGHTVEIVSAAWARPKLRWLEFVVSAKARSCILGYFKKLTHKEAVEIGHRMMDRELARYRLNMEKLAESQINALLSTFSHASVNSLLEEIGMGKRLAFVVVRQLDLRETDGAPLLDESIMEEAAARGAEPLVIHGTESMVLNYAKCCRPIPGDKIKGHVSSGRGLVVHTAGCRNVQARRQRPEDWVELAWDEDMQRDFPVDIRVDVSNRSGVLASIAAEIANLGINIENVGMEERDGFNTTLKFCISVHDRRHLADIMRRLRRLNIVRRIQRAK